MYRALAFVEHHNNTEQGVLDGRAV